MFVAAFTIACLLLTCFLSLLITAHAHFLYNTFLGAFPKLRKATISFVVSVRLSFCMAQLGFHWMDFYEI
jgi:hypothetical protein